MLRRQGEIARADRRPQKPQNPQRGQENRFRPKTRSPSSALLPFLWGEGSPTKIDYRKKDTLVEHLAAATCTSILIDMALAVNFSRKPPQK